MSNSFDEVDGADGPQQTLLMGCMSLGLEMEAMVKVRTGVVEKIIHQYRDGYYR